MKRYSALGLKQVNKTVARKLYNLGGEVLFVPCKLSPVNMWGLGIWQHKDLDGQYNNFDTLCNYYSYYNCTSETGKYIHFYIECNRY